jgi:glycylpeptide N-tetradecanoyltransferase
MEEKDSAIHKFWRTQPVPKTANESKDVEPPGRAIDPIKDPVKDVRQEPYTLPAGYEWYDANIEDEKDLNEVYSLLRDHYVEDDDNMFRFDYSPNFLKWALKPPGWKKEWHLCVRNTAKKFTKTYWFYNCDSCHYYSLRQGTQNGGDQFSMCTPKLENQ